MDTHSANKKNPPAALSKGEGLAFSTAFLQTEIVQFREALVLA